MRTMSASDLAMLRRRAAARTAVVGYRVLGDPVPERLEAFANGLTDDPGELDLEFPVRGRRPWWRRLLGA